MIVNKSLDLINILVNVSEKYLFSGQAKLKSSPYEKADKIVFGNSVANIVIAGSNMRIIFRIHYRYDSGEDVIKSTLRKEKISRVYTDDYFLEQCNLIAGRMKSTFAEFDSNIGISIPVKTNGFDDMFLEFKTDGEYTSDWHWDVNVSDIPIHCSALIEILDTNFDINGKVTSLDVDAEDDLEFF